MAGLLLTSNGLIGSKNRFFRLFIILTSALFAFKQHNIDLLKEQISERATKPPNTQDQLIEILKTFKLYLSWQHRSNKRLV